MQQINTQQFDELLNGGKTFVCDFFANWCNPCKMLVPVMGKMEEKYGDKADFVKVDIDENYDLAARYGIMSIPFVAVFKKGEQSAKTVGYMSVSEADEFMTKNL